MGYPFFGGRGGYLSGFGAVVAASVTTTGTVTAGVVAATTITAVTSVNVSSNGVVLNATGVDVTGGTGLINASQLNAPKIYVAESAAPGALANFAIIYATDAATKTQLSAKAGAAGTTVDVVTEA